MRIPFLKEKRNAAEFSEAFYDRNLFGRNPLGVDAPLAYAQTAHRLISQEDASFQDVDIATFQNELVGLQLELIGTAWTHLSNEEAAIANSEFTKQYLTLNERSDLWHTMAEYNQRIAASVTYGVDLNSKLGRGQFAFLDSMRIQLFNAWTTKGHDDEAVARVVNRLSSATNWRAGITPAMLGIRMLTRLEFEGTDAIVEKLAAIAFGYYQGAKEALDGIKLVA